MIQSVIVALIVLAAVVYSAWLLMPASWRRAGAARLADRAARSGLAASRARELQSRLERASGCGECSSCKGCADAGGTPHR